MFHVSAADHQRPTHARLHLRDARDAQLILEAVRLGILQIVNRRLNEAERTAYIKSGSVFVWEESDDELGLKRWTDGRFWSQSRMREPFLFYEERVVDRVPNEPRGSARGSPTSSSPSSPTARPPQGLVKQTYSAFVHGQGPLRPDGSPAKPRKLHLTAYLTYADVPNLPTIDLDPVLRVIAIPPGVYRSAKARSRQVDIENTYASHPSQQSPRGDGHVPPPPPAMSPAQYAASQFAHSQSPPPAPSPYAAMPYSPSPASTPSRYAYTPAPQSYPQSVPTIQHLPPHSHSHLPPGSGGGSYYGNGSAASSPGGYGSSSGYGPGFGLNGGSLGSGERRPDEDQRIISMLNARHVV
ncbi:Gti1/Pac2 family-domain-containing protein [Auriculariales sp. MPI-PUGE-AT-0066]|nr:Gti1/Pac2 family-domain-containing protein [Auriculariales sp. MPI-PUGE-AT-0066]